MVVETVYDRPVPYCTVDFYEISNDHSHHHFCCAKNHNSYGRGSSLTLAKKTNLSKISMKQLYLRLLPIAFLAPSFVLADSSLNGAKNVRKSSTAVSVLPDMGGRKPELTPGALPKRVLYVFAPNIIVNNVAEKLAVALQKGDSTIVGETLFLQPGGWQVLKDKCAIGKKNATKMSIVDPQQLKKNGGKSALEARFIKDKDEVKIAFEQISRILKDDGGFQVRSFTTAEMSKWWAYIGFNIEEPVFVVESKSKKFKFVMGFVDDSSVYVIDELNVLPDPES